MKSKGTNKSIFYKKSILFILFSVHGQEQNVSTFWRSRHMVYRAAQEADMPHHNLTGRKKMWFSHICRTVILGTKFATEVPAR